MCMYAYVVPSYHEGLCVQVLLAAGDTFRAAAAEQLAGWAERSGANIATASSSKQRPDAVLYSAVDRVQARHGRADS